MFVVFQKETNLTENALTNNITTVKVRQPIAGPWTLTFDTAMGGYPLPVVSDSLQDWSTHAEPLVKYFSGTATYTNQFQWNGELRSGTLAWLDLGAVANIAEVFVNEINCGILWTAPFRADISKAVRPGKNMLRIEVTNTWANRIAGDQQLPPEKRVTRTNAPYRSSSDTLLKAGLTGPVVLEVNND